MSTYQELLLNYLNCTDVTADQQLFVTAVFDVIRHRPEATASWARVTQELGLPRPAHLGSVTLDLAAFKAIFQRDRLWPPAPSPLQLPNDAGADSAGLGVDTSYDSGRGPESWRMLDYVLQLLPVHSSRAKQAFERLEALAERSWHERDQLAVDMARMVLGALEPEDDDRTATKLRLRLRPEAWLALPFDPQMQQRFQALTQWQKLPPEILGHYYRVRGESFLLRGQLEAAALNLAPAWIIFLLTGALDRAGCAAWRQAQALAWNGTVQVAIDVGERAMQLLAPRWTPNYAQHALWLARWYLAAARPVDAEHWLNSLPETCRQTDPLALVVHGLLALATHQADDVGTWPDEAAWVDAPFPRKAWLHLLAADQLAWRRQFSKAGKHLARLTEPWPEAASALETQWSKLQEAAKAHAWDPALAQSLIRDLERWSALPAVPWIEATDDVSDIEEQLAS